MASNETRNLLRELLGGIGYAIVKSLLRTVKIKIDVEQGHVLITKDEKTHKVKFDEIEQFLSEFSQ